MTATTIISVVVAIFGAGGFAKIMFDGITGHRARKVDSDAKWLGAQVTVIETLRDEIVRLRAEQAAVRAEQAVIQGKLDACQAESVVMREQLRQALSEVRVMSRQVTQLRTELDLLNGD